MADDGRPQMLRSTPVLKSGNYEGSRAFYRDKLGYRVLEEGGDPPRFGIFERDRSVLFVSAWQGAPTLLSGVWEAYVHVVGLDGLLTEFQAAGTNVRRTIETTAYGMREFEVTDPDGNVICFGEDADPAAAA